MKFRGEAFIRGKTPKNTLKSGGKTTTTTKIKTKQQQTNKQITIQNKHPNILLQCFHGFREGQPTEKPGVVFIRGGHLLEEIQWSYF